MTPTAYLVTRAGLRRADGAPLTDPSSTVWCSGFKPDW